MTIALIKDAPVFNASGSITFSQWNNLVADVALTITANPNSDVIAALNGISLQDILFDWCEQ